MTLIEKLTEAQENLAAVKTAVEAGEKNADDLTAAIENMKSVQADVDAADEAEKLIKSLAPGAGKADQEEKEVEFKSIGEFAAHELKEANIDTKKKFSFVTPEFKAAAPMTTPSSMAYGLSTYDMNIVPALRRNLQVRDLFAAETISGASLTYYVESSTVEGAAAYTTEGTKKPLVSFGDPTAKTVALAKIAAHIKDSDELIEDAPRLASAIESRLIYQQQLAVENYLVSELAGTSGIGTASVLTPDGIFNAIMTVMTNSGFSADVILINPTDYANLRLRKDGNGQYLAGGFAFGGYGNGAVELQPSIWGIPTIVSSAVEVGTCIVGAFKAGASVVSKASGLRVEVTNTDQDDFVKNMITIRAEERLALAVRYPAAFVKITGSSTSTAA